MAFEPKRIPDIITLHDAVQLDDDPTSANSSAFRTEPYKKFALFLDIDSTLAPTDLRVIVQFSNDGGTTWFDLMNDFFGDLRYEDTAVAAGVKEIMEGPCAGRLIRVRLVATGTDATNFFTVSAYLELYR